MLMMQNYRKSGRRFSRDHAYLRDINSTLVQAFHCDAAERIVSNPGDTVFLDADKHPTIDFVSTSVEKLSDHAVRVSGDLTLLGVTKPLKVDVAVRRAAGGEARLEFKAETRIDRLEFGMNSGFPLVSREVDLTIKSSAAEL